MSRLTDSLLGLSEGPARAPNTYSVGRYLAILVVILIGLVYSLPNLYPPDYALQIRAEAADVQMTQEIVDKATQALGHAGIHIKGTHMDPRSAVLRLDSNEDQLRGSEIVQAALHGDNATASQFVVALNLASTTPQWLQSLGAHPMSYGLDLSGGVHFLLEVDMEKAIGDRMKSEEDNIRRILRDARLRYVPANDMVSGTKVTVAFYEAPVRDQAQEAISKEYRDFQILPRDVDGKPALLMTMKETKIREIETYAIQQNLQSLRNRVNELGVSEPLVQSLGKTRIVVDLPGVQDSADAKRILNKFANLEFRLVAKQDARPSETETYPYEGRSIIVERRNIVTGDRVTNAVQDYDPQNNLPQVSITLDGAGGDRMHDATKDNVGNQMAILYKELKPRSRIVVEDGKEVVQNFSVEEKRLINVATIRSALGYRFRITGVGLGEARDLALLLRAGALAAPMYIVEERTVGASLGEDNIRAGLHAAVGGYILVLLCMVIYYKAFGMIANIALAINVILLVALMSVLGATLTMPGIAGIVLTMGMAVDANVLIFSRVREEAAERPPQAAITAGFDRAYTTIVDSNITHLLVAVILLAFGSGPIKGFAVVLTLGIITSMFTAITVTRAMVNLMYGGRSLTKLRV
ncbi:MAG TPA: protein translocase subunit SecD [Pseudomonadales bacterium]|nr:protein translocase subunit SecD [Pseudomonadales bacterium]